MSAIIRATAVAACVAVLTSASSAAAQDGGIGVKGGIVVASQHNSGTDAASSPGSRAGAVAGGFVVLPVASWLSLQAEGLYASKGARSVLLGIASTLQIDYLEIPVLARVRIGGGRLHYYAAGGIAPALRLRARTRTAFSGAVEEIDVADQVERLDLAVAGGGGVVVGRWDVDVRYTYGLRDVDADRTDSITTKNRALAVTAGFRF